MSLRPVAARWFEMLVMRDDLTVAVDVLAQSARVELQGHGETKAPLLMPECRELLEEIDELERRFARYWPVPRPHEPDERFEPHVMLQLAVQRLRDWSAEAAAVVDRLEEQTSQFNDLELLQTMFRDAGPLPDLEQFSRAGPILETCLYLLAPGKWPESLPDSVITRRLVTPDHTFLLGVGLVDEIATLHEQLNMQKARLVQLPPDLPATASEAEALVSKRLAASDRQIAETWRELEALHDRHDIADALADAGFVRWYVENIPDLASTENFAWITGWTSDADGKLLLKLLADAGVKGLLRLSKPPPGFEPPLLLRNPRWMRPFEVFSGMLGVPSVTEADPTRIVAIASPLMFGYMFGDVAHGIVLMVAGLVLSRRFPALRLLIAGGVASIAFGFLFGSVFALENVITPLWVHPLENPVLILLVPLAGGAVLLLIGMSLDAMQAYWKQQGRFWWETGAGLLLCYLALLGSLGEPRLLWLALVGAAWFVIGNAFVSPGHRLAATGSAAVEFLESLLQLVVNTISFVRVGAFALAHAGLSLAVVGLAEAPASLSGKLLVLVLGNILIIGLEGLVVAIQTTRLVLFEFFVRFRRAEGRPFKPLAPPPSHLPDEPRRS